MKNLPEIYEEADENDVMILEHKIGGRKSIINTENRHCMIFS